MKMTRSVSDFVSKTQTGFCHFSFRWFDDEIGDKVTNLSVAEVAGEFTRCGGKLRNIDAIELGRRFAEMRRWKDYTFTIERGI